MNQRAFNIQGLVFCAVAMLSILTTTLFPRLPGKTEIILLAICIILLGVPHGALDTVFARHTYKVRTPKDWAVFTVAYFTPALLVIIIWQAFPVIFLIGFLAISAAHFSGDLMAGTPWMTRILYGGTILVLPTLLQANEVGNLFGFLVGVDAGIWIAQMLHLLSFPWLVLTIAAAIIQFRSNWVSGFEIMYCVVLACWVPPLLAFTIFFCIMHSARHIMRAIGEFVDLNPHRVLLAAVTPMFLTFCVALMGWLFLAHVPLDARIIQLTFVGLAALTVPHMAIIERVRFMGWKVERS